MAPYAPSSSDSANNRPGKPTPEDVIFSLTERLRKRDSEIRQLRREKSELEDQLLDHGKPLLAHLKQREEDFESGSKKQEEAQRDLEMEICRLKEKLHASRKILDDQEENLALIERETDDHLRMMQQRLDVIMSENEEKDRRLVTLEDLVDKLTLEGDQFKKRANEDKSLLSRLGERCENYRHDTHRFETANQEMKSVVNTQRRLLKEKEKQILEIDRYRKQKEGDLDKIINRMRRQHNDFVDAQRVALEDREEEIHLLYRQCEKYENLIDEAEYVTNEQRADLRVKKQEIEQLSTAIESVQNTGLFAQLDKMCSSSKTT